MLPKVAVAYLQPHTLLYLPSQTQWLYGQTRKAAQGVAQYEVSATRVVVDAALRRIRKSRHGGHNLANISVNCQWI